VETGPLAGPVSFLKPDAHPTDAVWVSRAAAAAAAILCVAVTGCAGASNDSLSVDEARDKPPSEVVRVEGPVVIQYGDAMICTALTESSPPQCEAGLWLRGPSRQLREQEFRADGGVQWAESARLEGTVDGNGFFVLAP
jgi:hypothetical protein